MLTRWIARGFGVALVALSLFVAVETILRKVANQSLQGADELGGYVLAVGSTLAFVVALADRAHIRIDALHRRLPLPVRAALDGLAALTLAALGTFLFAIAVGVLRDSALYGSTAATVWATPLVWPQAFWIGALAVFALVALVQAGRVARLLVQRRWQAVVDRQAPRSERAVLEEELVDAERR